MAATFYLRLANCSDPMALQNVCALLWGLGSIRASGLGTAKDSGSAWIELQLSSQLRSYSINDLRARLNALGLTDAAVPEVIAIDKGEGKVQAKQLDLFARAQ